VYAITIREPGGPDVLTWSEVPDPEPGPDEVLIDVVASAVNRADLLQRAGFYAPPPGASAYPGLECSGRVKSVGSEVSTWRVDDEVCALLSGGGYAQEVVAPAAHCLPVPSTVSLVDSAGLPEAACTVWSNMFVDGGLQALEAVLIHGGGSGIGTFAIQLAAAHGARVITTARASKHEALKELGAEVTIDYTSEDFVASVRTATGGHGADVILDIMGGSYLERNIEALATGGRLVVVGLQGGRAGSLNIGLLLQKRGIVRAAALRSRAQEEKAEIIAGVRAHVWPLIESGMVRPIVHSRVPMPVAARAHRLVDASEHIGKVLLLTT
jgi:putative PIG3 family NAD(P)H quinone oxidoreductase